MLTWCLLLVRNGFKHFAMLNYSIAVLGCISLWLEFSGSGLFRRRFQEVLVRLEKWDGKGTMEPSCPATTAGSQGSIQLATSGGICTVTELSPFLHRVKETGTFTYPPLPSLSRKPTLLAMNFLALWPNKPMSWMWLGIQEVPAKTGTRDCRTLC